MSTPDPLASPSQEAAVPVLVIETNTPSDPPPPYPSRDRRTRQPRPGRRRRTQEGSEHSHTQGPSDEYETVPPHSSGHYFPDGADDADASETTPLLSPHPAQQSPVASLRLTRRQRTLSHSSTLHSTASLAPSFAHTVFSAFHPERDTDIDPECREEPGFGFVEDGTHLRESSDDAESPIGRDDRHRSFAAELSGFAQPQAHRAHLTFAARFRRYMRPLRIRAYYAALFHLLVVNFPYGLLAWVFLFVFTLTGTGTLMALPLGAVLCFVDLFGARLLARGELAIQTTFHGPLSYSPPYPPLPIFTRMRPPTVEQLEAGITHPIPERSFYRNAYAMFTDPTSYQALFYFLVIKPGITLLMFIFFVVIAPVSLVLVLPAPAMLRLARRLGIWQANVAVEGLAYTAR